MPLQNRVLPNGEITAIPARGTLTGNRGIIHRNDKTLGVSRWSHHAWICCTLDWQGRTRDVMTGRNWTELFFLDEAVAIAAGHRPCGYCRRAAYAAYRDAWGMVAGQRVGAKAMDAALHKARVDRKRQQITYSAGLDDLPDGTFVQYQNAPHLWLDQRLHPYTPDGYDAAIVAPTETMVTVLTPQPSVAVLKAGFKPLLHPSANPSKT
jgi:hypothetical protein